MRSWQLPLLTQGGHGYVQMDPLHEACGEAHKALRHQKGCATAVLRAHKRLTSQGSEAARSCWWRPWAPTGS